MFLREQAVNSLIPLPPSFQNTLGGGGLGKPPNKTLFIPKTNWINKAGLEMALPFSFEHFHR